MPSVTFKGTLRQVAGRAQVQVELPASRHLSDLLENLERQFPGILGSAAEYQWRHGTSEVVVAVNGKVIEQGETTDIQLGQNDEIDLLPPIGGGDDNATGGGSLPNPI